MTTQVSASSAAVLSGTDADARNDAEGKSLDTLFVRNIARGVNEDELRDLFGEIGPVKQCFLVVEKFGPNKGSSKGFGFVQFALEDDAEEASKKLNGHLLAGKKILIDKAAKRGYKASADEKRNNRQGNKGKKALGSENRNEKNARENIFTRLSAQATVVGEGNNEEKSSKKQRDDAQKKEEMLRSCTVVFFGIPKQLNESQFKKKVSKIGKINALEFPVSSFRFGRSNDSEGTTSALVIYTNQSNAGKAVSKFSGKEWDGCKHGSPIHVRRMKQIATNTKSQSGCRLIVRNVAFNVKREQIYQSFARFGPLTDIDMTGGDDSKKTTGKKRNRGFVFVQFACRSDAQKAVQNLNGKPIGKRPVAIDFAVESSRYKKQKSKDSQVAKNDENESKSEPEDEDGPNVEDESGDESEKDESEDQNSGHEEDSFDEDEDEDESGDEKEDEAEAEEDEDATEDQYKGQLTRNKASENALTIFIRNLAFEVTEDDVYKHFRRYGGVKYAKIVRDAQTKRSKGVGFVQYYNTSGVEKALKAAAATPLVSARQERLKQKLRSNTGIAKLDGGTGIFMSGRPLVVCKAVDRSEAKSLTEEGEKKTKVDRRHLYLSREGMVHANPSLANNIPKLDLNKRINSEAERKTKLKSPLFFVSPTRLAIKNLNRNEKPVENADKNDDFVTDAILKSEFLKAAKLGMEKQVVGDNEGDPYLFPVGWPKNRARFMKPKIIQCRVIRDNEDGTRNKNRGRPKGYGFVEFSEHVHALACLRMMNNNPDYAYLAYGGKASMKRTKITRSRLIVEFAVENAAKVRERQRKVDMVKRRQQLQSNRQKVEKVTEDSSLESSRKRKQEKFQSERESQIDAQVDTSEQVDKKGTKKQKSSSIENKTEKKGKKRKSALDPKIADSKQMTGIKEVKKRKGNVNKSSKKSESSIERKKSNRTEVDELKSSFFGSNEPDKKISRWFD